MVFNSKASSGEDLGTPQLRMEVLDFELRSTAYGKTTAHRDDCITGETGPEVVLVVDEDGLIVDPKETTRRLECYTS